MGYRFETIPGEPILIYTQLSGEGDPLVDLPASINEALSILNEQTSPIFIINDLRELRLNLDQILHGASVLARGSNALMHHPMIRENIFVVTDGMLKTAINGLTSATFGQVKLARFDTVEQALDYCREKIAPGDAMLR